MLGRLIQAIGAGCALTLVRAIARDAFRAEQIVKAIAYLTMFGTLGPMTEVKNASQRTPLEACFV